METNNMNIRERFEEIWPVPDGVYWKTLSRNGGEYMADPRLTTDNRTEAQFAAEEWDARLDTFTRCQETTDVYVSLVDQLVKELEEAQPWILQDNQYMECGDLLIRAKQIMEHKK